MKENNKSNNKNPYDLILDTYNAEKFPIIQNVQSGLVFPFSMKADDEVIDPSAFYENNNKKMF